MNTTLTSPIMDVSTLENVNLSYNYDYNNLVSTKSADLDVSANGGATWTNVHHWNTDMRGPNTFTQDVTALLGDSTQAQIRYHYIAPGWDWWWEVDNVFVGEKLCHPIGGGGLVVGRVADANDNHALVGAQVSSGISASAIAMATADPAMGNFYALFQPVGDHLLTATMQKYSPATATVSVPLNNAIRQDFALQTGHLTYSPVFIDETIPAGGTTTVEVTVNNIGGGAATFELLELDKGSVPFGPIEESPALLEASQQNSADALSLGLPSGPDVEPLAAGDILQSWPTGMLTPWGIAFDGQDGTVWIGDGWGTLDAVMEFDPDGTATGRQWQFNWPTTNGPADMTYNWNTGMLWTMNVNTGVSNCIYEIDPSSGPTGSTICPGGGTGFTVSQRGLAYDPATDTYFAGNWSDLTIHRFEF